MRFPQSSAFLLVVASGHSGASRRKDNNDGHSFGSYRDGDGQERRASRARNGQLSANRDVALLRHRGEASSGNVLEHSTVEGTRYTYDVVIDGGKVRKRKKGPSKQFREKFGHTPLSTEEEIPWGGKRLIVGTGAHGALPVMNEVRVEAKRRGIEIITAPTPEVSQLLEEVKKGQVYAILHCTC